MIHYSDMVRKIKSFFVLVLVASLGFTSSPALGAPSADKGSTDKKLHEFLNDIKAKKEVLTSLTSTAAKVDSPVVIHFLWASWCEYCERAYTSLMELKNKPEAKGKIQILGYCLDEQINSVVKEKLKEMPAVEHFHLDRNKIKSPAEMNRLPAVLVENKKTNELTAYTGFTSERFRYMKKSILRTLSEQTGDVNED
jgi:thiol-disulfide isomerase/thioredoxin